MGPNPQFEARCREAGRAAWSICCLRKVLEQQGFQPKPLVGFIHNLADGVQGQSTPAEEIANITIAHFGLQKRVLKNLGEICRLCRLMELTIDQTIDLCLATEPDIDPDGLKEMIVRHYPD